MKLEDRICGSLLLGAIGDSMGYHTTQSASAQLDSIANQKLPFSCATVMTLFTCEGLIHGYNRGAASGISSSVELYVDDAYLNYLRLQGYPLHGAWSRWSDLLHAESQLGKPQQKAIDCVDTLLTGSGTLDEPINERKDCGGLIRVAPVGFVQQYGKRYDDSLDEVAFWQGVKVCALTHGSPLGYLPGGIFCDILHNILLTDGITLKDACFAAVQKSASLFPECPEENRIITQAITDALTCDRIDSSIKCSEDALSMLSWAILCTRSAMYDAELALTLAATHSSVPNALSSLTGQLLGTIIGIDRIPANLRHLCNEDIVLEIAEQLCQVANEMLTT